MKLLSITILSLSLISCSSYASFIDSLEKHQVNSCIEANLSVGSALAGNQALVRVYTATGGQQADICFRLFKGQVEPLILIQENGFFRRIKE